MDEIQLKIEVPDLSSHELISFKKSMTVYDAKRLIMNQNFKGLIKNVDSYGLCYQRLKKKRKSKMDVTEWLENYRTFEYYHLKNNDVLLLKLRNFKLLSTLCFNVVIPSYNEKLNLIEHASPSTIGQVIKKIVKSFKLDKKKDWKLWLPLSSTNCNIGIWLDPKRPVLSYYLNDDLHMHYTSDPEKKDHDIPLRTLVLCKNPNERKKIIEKNHFVPPTSEEEWWATIMAEDLLTFRKNNITRFKKIIRKGVPACLRGDIWCLLTGAKQAMQSNPLVYEKLVQSKPYPENEKQILLDLNRTKPDHPIFKDDRGISALKRVLLSYSNYDSDIGYCQGMNFIVALLLLNMSEEQAFWTLHMIVHRYGTKGMYTGQLMHLDTALSQYETYIEDFLPEIYAHFNKEDTTVGMFATAWLHTLFSRDGDLDFVFRTWDCFFNEGFSVIFRIAIALLKESTAHILKYTVEELLNYLKVVIKQITDIEHIFKIAYIKIPKNKLIAEIYNQDTFQKLKNDKTLLHEKVYLNNTADPLDNKIMVPGMKEILTKDVPIAKQEKLDLKKAIAPSTPHLRFLRRRKSDKCKSSEIVNANGNHLLSI